MDLLYSRYASPMEFMNIYIANGRFGEFVSNILEMDFKRKREKAEEENENKLWTMYVHSMAQESFNDWKSRVMNPQNKKGKVGNDENLTDSDIEDIINSLF